MRQHDIEEVLGVERGDAEFVRPAGSSAGSDTLSRHQRGRDDGLDLVVVERERQRPEQIADLIAGLDLVGLRRTIQMRLPQSHRPRR